MMMLHAATGPPILKLCFATLLACTSNKLPCLSTENTVNLAVAAAAAKHEQAFGKCCCVLARFQLLGMCTTPVLVVVTSRFCNCMHPAVEKHCWRFNNRLAAIGGDQMHGRQSGNPNHSGRRALFLLLQPAVVCPHYACCCCTTRPRASSVTRLNPGILFANLRSLA